MRPLELRDEDLPDDDLVVIGTSTVSTPTG